MTITGADIIPISSTLDDKKSGSLDMSESLFEDYDLLLNDTRNDHQTASKDHDSLLSGFFHDENDGISDHSSSNTFSPNNKIENKRPRVMQWGPQDGQEESTIVSVVLEHTEETGPMKLVFGSITVETAQQQHTIPSISNNHTSVWITLAASVPSLSDTMSETNQTQLSVCAFDCTDPDVAIDTWNIGKFTYRDISEEAQSRKRALSDEPDEISQKKIAYDIKHDGDGDVNSQLLKLLSPYEPLLPVSSEESPNLATKTQPTTSWISSPMDNQLNFSQPIPSNLYNLQNPFIAPPKQDVYLNCVEIQRQKQPYLMQLQQQQQQFMSQAMNNYLAGNYHPFNSTSSSSNMPNYRQSNPLTYSIADQEKQQYHRLHQQIQQHQQQIQQHQQQMQQNQQQRQHQHQQSRTEQYNVPRRSSAPISSYSITNSNSCALNKAHLKLNGDLMDMLVNWSMSEWQSGRRLIQFWRNSNQGPDGSISLVECGFEPMDQQMYHQQRMRDNVAAVAAAAAAAVAVSNSSSSTMNLNPHTSRSTPIVISCIYWRERNDYFITSVDCIYLLESLIGIQFTVEEKNRIRRNLEGFRPLTVSKCKVECADFFKLIMSFPHPKPRNIEKDVKVFAWKTLPHALRKIIRKYTPSYITSTPLEPIQQHPHRSISTSHVESFPPSDMF
ncbi:hypothetical protein BD770DRAFT_389900 [Pilaira anomala]|nr:hypothetical protein BD770DRAFT_389900 [Pilaira anomala]